MTTELTDADRELLLMSAKAMGYTSPTWLISGGREDLIVTFTPRPNWRFGPWRPLTDDAVAFQIMVKLGLGVQTDGVSYALVRWSHAEKDVLSEFAGDDLAAATRLAITRAAAAMGELL